MEKPEINPERVFMIAGEDEHGDQHMFVTSDAARAAAWFRDKETSLSNLHGNDGFETFVRPLLDGS